MEKNTLLAIVLSTAFLIVWFLLIQPKHSPQTIDERQSQPITRSLKDNKPGAQETTQKASKETSLPLHDGKEILIKTPKAKILFTTRGAAIKKWEIDDISGWVDLVLHTDGGAYPLATFPGSIFTTQSKSFEIKSGEKARDISFSHTTDDGMVIHKTYRIHPDSFMVDLFITLTNRSTQKIIEKQWSLSWGPGLSTIARELKDNMRYMRAVGYRDKDLIKYRSQQYPEQVNWAAVDNRYFLAALIPQLQHDFEYISVQAVKKQPPTVAWHASTTMNPGEEKNFSFKVYVGPKGYTHLKKLGHHLEASINFGPFGFLGKVALQALNFFHNLTGNYGWSIILLTICLQFFFIPLTLKSFKATLAMKKLQPQIKALQAKYKEDHKRLNMEMMNLYKSSGTNPFGGCMPMLLQIPVFWALFTTLRNAFELRGAPFILWIKDLSIHDPFYVLPILMGLGMLLQQRVMSVSADPNQARMMLFMPIIFTFFFLKFPAGLVLYWFTNSLLTMGVQFVIMQRSKK